jgi:hypothetical protein
MEAHRGSRSITPLIPNLVGGELSTSDLIPGKNFGSHLTGG